MNGVSGDMCTYLLVDNGLLQERSAGYSETDAKRRPIWLEPIYAARALEVSPLLIDVEAAYEAGDLDVVMGYMNACKPALHVSIIESGLSHVEIARHFRRFIFIFDPEGRQFTLRFSDCAVLGPLSSLLTQEQWATVSGPITRWGIHTRSMPLIHLLPMKPYTVVPTPLHLDQGQLTALEEASEPDHVIAQVKMMRHGADLPGNVEEQHEWAKAARLEWLASNNINSLFLLFLTESVMLTRGELLRMQEIKIFLAMDSVSAFREKLDGLAQKYNSKNLII